MKISIFTPTHNAVYLPETYRSIADQDFDEWVIVRNGKALLQDFDFLKSDPRVRIIDFKEDGIVGLLKNTACHECSGDILVELDHDDLLAPNCISEIRSAFKDDDIGFVYSNAAYFKNDWTPPQRFNSACGWAWREFEYQGKKLDELLAFPPTPASVSRVWFAPDHVRAWRKSVYLQVGGHDKTLPVLDDSDLIIRTYMVTKFKHINKCLYLYRNHEGNTCYSQTWNQQIQLGTVDLYRKHIHKLCERWCDLNELSRVNLGGEVPGYTNYIKDLDKKWWFLKDNSIGLIRASDILQRIPDKLHVMKEAHRVLVPGGYLLIDVPSALGEGAYQDPRHVSFWVRNSFLYYTNSNQASYIGNTTMRFQEMLVENYYPSQYHKDLNILYVRAELIKIDNNQRLPGAISI